jgi:hypothetical protein
VKCVPKTFKGFRPVLLPVASGLQEVEVGPVLHQEAEGVEVDPVLHQEAEGAVPDQVVEEADKKTPDQSYI